MICDRPDRGPKCDIVYGPPSAMRRHWIRQVGCSHGRAAHRRQDTSDDRQVTA